MNVDGTDTIELDGPVRFEVDDREDTHVAVAAAPPRSTSRVSLVVLAVLAVLYTMYFARAVLLPIVFSCVLALLLRPLTRSLTRRGLPHMASAFVVVAGAVVLIGWCASFVVQPARDWVESAPAEMARIRLKLDSVRKSIAGIASASHEIGEITAANGDEKPVPVEVKQSSLGDSFLGQTGSALASAAVTTVLVFFLLARLEPLIDAILSFLDVAERRERVREGLMRIERDISRYLLTVTLINAGLGIVTGIALAVIGLENAVLWGVMAMFMNYIPFLGAWAGTAIVGFVSMLTFDDPAYAMLAPGMFMLLTSIEGNFVTPMILGHSMSLDPYIVFVALVVIGWMWGVAGAVLAVPLLAITRSICEQFDDSRPMALLIGGQTRKRWQSEKLVP